MNDAERYSVYLQHHSRMTRIGAVLGPLLSLEDYLLAEENFYTAGHNLTEWMLDHVAQDPQADPIGKELWDEVTRWSYIAAM